MSYPICRDLQLQDRFFDGVLCRAATTVNLSTGRRAQTGGCGDRLRQLFFGARCERRHGKGIGECEDDGTPGANPVVVLSYDFWKTQLAERSGCDRPKGSGKPKPDDGHRRRRRGRSEASTLAKFHPSGFPLPCRRKPFPVLTAYWTAARAGCRCWAASGRTLRWRRHRLGCSRGSRRCWTRTHAAPGSPESRRNAAAVSRVDTRAHSGATGPFQLAAQAVRSRSGSCLAATAVLLGLACLNVAGLFLARGSAREREISTRLALGASRGRIGRQLLADSVLLALTGGSLGVALAPIAMRALIAFLPRDAAANALQSTVDSRLLLFAFLVSVAAGVLSGFAPALQAGRAIADLLAEGARRHSIWRCPASKSHRDVQIAFTLVLVIGAALFVRTLTGLMAKGPGFTTSSLVSFGLDPRRNGYSRQEASQLIRRIHDEIRAAARQPDVCRRAVPVIDRWKLEQPHDDSNRSSESPPIAMVNLNAVSPGFFATLGIQNCRRARLRRTRLPAGGRDRPALGDRQRSLCKRYLAGRSPLGARICQGAGPDAKPNIEIVGVVADFSYRGLREESEQAYFPIFEGERVQAAAFT